jgi:hypothetical protein
LAPITRTPTRFPAGIGVEVSGDLEPAQEHSITKKPSRPSVANPFIASPRPLQPIRLESALNQFLGGIINPPRLNKTRIACDALRKLKKDPFTIEGAYYTANQYDPKLLKCCRFNGLYLDWKIH